MCSQRHPLLILCSKSIWSKSKCFRTKSYIFIPVSISDICMSAASPLMCCEDGAPPTALFSSRERYPLEILVTPNRRRIGSSTFSHSRHIRSMSSSVGVLSILRLIATPERIISSSEKCFVSFMVSVFI